MAPIALIPFQKGEKEKHKIAVGDLIPDGTLSYFDDDQDQMQNVYSFFGIGLKHVPTFLEKSEELKSKGVEEILLISVNDPFVMKEWRKSYGDAKNVKFLADGSASYTRALGLELDLSNKGLGVRSRRFAMLVDNLKVVAANIEEGGEFTISGADEILKAL
uniref:peroxiredoxin-2-like n=1 Tax=Erigeron canadensis TaxID=72917 RepID=UPI001CB9AE03|nr:peroxiredoxin-2-like [Erigeron canadensis]